MKAKDPWHLLRTGQVEKGLRQCRKAYDEEPEASEIMQLGAAYLWVQKYAAAWEHFRLSIEQYPRSMSCFYGMAGAAKWCMGEPDEAVRQWSTGLKAQYADTNGLGMQLPLLLYMASVLEPGSYGTASAEAILKKKAKDRRANEWPGPIALWLLGQISAEELRERCTDDHPDAHLRLVETWCQHWEADFYLGVRCRASGMQQQFNETMRKLVDTARPEWSDQDFFLSRMWGEEFFIARREANGPPSIPSY